MITVCFHGAESTGKSVLAQKLANQPGWDWVPEYGRTYCEERGTDLAMDDLLAIAEGEGRAIANAAALNPDVLILDTDQLMTAAWAIKLLGHAPHSLMAWPKADLYLLFEPDVPWIGDGTRLFGERADRARFAAIAKTVLDDAGVPFSTITGDWAERERAVRARINAALDRMNEGFSPRFAPR